MPSLPAIYFSDDSPETLNPPPQNTEDGARALTLGTPNPKPQNTEDGAQALTLSRRERLPGGLGALGACEGHFSLVDSFRLWSSKARRRLRFTDFVREHFYVTWIEGMVRPFLHAWRR
jgi:hypothetical protein